jgi:hypothetical protein
MPPQWKHHGIHNERGVETCCIRRLWTKSSAVPAAICSPQAFPEAAPLHPAYPSGHATVAGACSVVLKSLFDEGALISNCVHAAADGCCRLLHRSGREASGEGRHLPSRHRMRRSKLPFRPLCPRDRDRLRQEILEKLGWKIHRVLSTDWFRSRDGEIKRLVRRIEDLLQSDPAYQEMREKAARRDSLRQRLIELRDGEITQAFSDTPNEKCLLRDGVLEEFIQKRPRSRDEWFRKIPEQVRSSIDSKQVGRYLDRVLGIIVDCG